MQRLSREQDIQYIIEMNRLSRLLHKTFMLSRQRRAVKHAHKFVIADQDLASAARTDPFEQAASADLEAVAQKILAGFDPESDKMDRRLLYEITGLRLATDEFRDDDSSNSDDEQLDGDITGTDPLE